MEVREVISELSIRLLETAFININKSIFDVEKELPREFNFALPSNDYERHLIYCFGRASDEIINAANLINNWNLLVIGIDNLVYKLESWIKEGDTFFKGSGLVIESSILLTNSTISMSITTLKDMIVLKYYLQALKDTYKLKNADLLLTHLIFRVEQAVASCKKYNSAADKINKILELEEEGTPLRLFKAYFKKEFYSKDYKKMVQYVSDYKNLGLSYNKVAVGFFDAVNIDCK